MKISIYFSTEQCTLVDIDVTAIYENHYRLNEAPTLIEDVGIFDVIETEKIDESKIKFVRVSESADWTTYSWAIPKITAESESLTEALRTVETNGGKWDRVFGGLLNVYIPPGSDYDPSGLIDTTINNELDA